MIGEDDKIDAIAFARNRKDSFTEDKNFPTSNDQIQPTPIAILPNSLQPHQKSKCIANSYVVDTM